MQEFRNHHVFQEKIVELASQSLEELRALRRELTTRLTQASRHQRVFEQKMVELASQHLEELRAMRRDFTSPTREHDT